MKYIQLSQNQQAIVDKEDFEWLNQKRWYAKGPDSHPEAYRAIWEKGKQTNILMHREILNAPDGVEVDHVNRNSLDNRRSNLRLCSHSENGMNRKLQSNSTSGFKGVSWKADKRKWRASIKKDGRQKHLGYFTDITQAARAYNVAAEQLFGEFAVYNQISGWPLS